MAVGTLIVGAIIKKIPKEKFDWTEELNIEQDQDDNKLLQWKTMFTDKLNAAQ